MAGLGMTPPSGEQARLPAGAWVAALLYFALHLLPQPGYGFHRDEFLYFAMGDHLDFFRMQFPPLMAVLAQAARTLPVDLLFAARLLPALAGTLLTILTALICRELGGGRGWQVLAASTILVAPLFMRAGTLFHPTVFEQLWWTVAAFALARLLTGKDRRWWLAVGGAAGVSALTKFSAAFLAAGLLAAIVFSPLRAHLRTRWPWLGASIAALIALPSFTGQAAWGWPFFEQARVLQERQLVHVDRLGFVLDQFMMLGAGAALWVVGFGALMLAPSLRRFRPLGILAGTIFLLLMIGGGKAYYFGPMQPLLLAAAVAWIGGAIPVRWQRPALVGAGAWMVLGGVALLPMGLPLLPPAQMARYTAALGVTQAATTNYGTTLPLPQDYADMTGWEELVDSVAAVYHALPAAERSSASIFGINYGRTGALALFGPPLGLPYPFSRHGDFFGWGFAGLGQGVTIVVGDGRDGLDVIFEEVTEAARVRNRWGVDEEQEVSIWVCRRPRVNLRDLVQREGVIWG